MFTKPPLPNWHTATRRIPKRGPRNTGTLQDQAQQDLARLLGQMSAAAAKVPPYSPQMPKSSATNPPPIPRLAAKLVPTSASAARRPAANAGLSTSPSVGRLKLPELKTAIAIVALVASAALTASALGFIVLSGGLARAEGTLKAHDARIEVVQSRQDSLKRAVETRLANMQSQLMEVKYPPSEFGEAQDLFRAGRYSDAEAAYTAFLLRYPNSRLADIALNNAAVASAMRNNCTMAAAYVARLKAQFPASPFNASLATLVPSCQRLRVAALADTATHSAQLP